jgi:hypothetical protein
VSNICNECIERKVTSFSLDNSREYFEESSIKEIDRFSTTFDIIDNLSSIASIWHQENLTPLSFFVDIYCIFLSVTNPV